MTSYMSTTCAGRRARSRRSSARPSGSAAGFIAALAYEARHQREIALGQLDGLLVEAASTSPQPETSQCMRAPPSSRASFLADGHLHMRGLPRRASLAIDHDDEVGQRRQYAEPAGDGPKRMHT